MNNSPLCILKSSALYILIFTYYIIFFVVGCTAVKAIYGLLSSDNYKNKCSFNLQLQQGFHSYFYNLFAEGAEVSLWTLPTKTKKQTKNKKVLKRSKK